MTQEALTFTTEKPLKLILRYCLPAVIAMTINGIQGMVDGIFVGRLIGPSALASVNIAGPYLQLIIGLSMIASIGTQSQVGIYFGSGKDKMAKDTFQTLLRMVTILAIVIGTIGFCGNEKIAEALGAEAALLKETACYIKTISIFVLPICLMFYLGFLNRIVGKPHLYFYGALVSMIVNISLDSLFLIKLNLGIQGAAMATGMAYMTAFFIVAIPFCHKDGKLTIIAGSFNKKTILPVLYNGASEGINAISAAVTLFLFNKAMIGVAGAEGVAAFTAVNYMGNFGILLLFGVSDGVGPIVSYNYGAGKSERVKKIMHLAYTGNLILGLMIFSTLFFFGDYLVGLFIKDNAQLALFAANGARIYAFSFLLSGFNILVSGYFTFIGKGLESAIVASSRGIICVSIGMLLLPRLLGVPGIWMSVPFAEGTTFLIAMKLLRGKQIRDVD